MNAPQWVHGLRMCGNYRFNLQSLEKRQRTPTPANGCDRNAISLSGLRNYRNLEKRLGSISGHVSKVDVSRGAINGGSRLNNSITPDSAKPPSDSAACHWTGPVTGRKTKRHLVVATNTPGAARPSALRVGWRASPATQGRPQLPVWQLRSGRFRFAAMGFAHTQLRK
jgi:hypothetical protein